MFNVSKVINNFETRLHCLNYAFLSKESLKLLNIEEHFLQQAKQKNLKKYLTIYLGSCQVHVRQKVQSNRKYKQSHIILPKLPFTYYRTIANS